MATPPSSSPYPPQQPAPRPWRRALGDWWRTQPGHYQLGCLLGGGIVVLTTLAVVIAGTAGFIQALTASSTGVTPSVTASSPSSTSPSPSERASKEQD